jgi:nucleoside-diphosphate-sugar epimerase
MRHYADVSKARGMFGFTASIDIEEGLEKYIGWFTSRGYDYKDLLRQEKVFNWE